MVMMLRSGGSKVLKVFAENAVFRSPLIFDCSNSRNFSTKRASSLPLTCGAAVNLAEDGVLLGDPPVKLLEMEPTLLQPRVVVYDGVCHLCHRGVKWVIQADKDKKIKFCCVQSKAAEPYMRISGADREDVLRSFLFVEGPGLYHRGSTAALKVASYLPLPYSALRSLLIVPRPLREAVYDYVAKRRYHWFGKAADCLVLKEKELLERFIDWDELLYRSSQDSD